MISISEIISRAIENAPSDEAEMNFYAAALELGASEVEAEWKSEEAYTRLMDARQQ